MKKVLFVIKHTNGFFEIWVNKLLRKRFKNLGRCVIFIAQYIFESRIQNYEIYAFDKGRQTLIKNFNVDVIYDFIKDKKDSILSFGEYDDDINSDNDSDFEFDDDNEDIEYSSNRRSIKNNFQKRKRISTYTPKDNSYELEVIKENIKNFLG
jgi:hypothetical protein